MNKDDLQKTVKGSGILFPPSSNLKPRSGLRGLWAWWKEIAEKIGNFQARLILCLLYFVAVAPFALAVRFFSDPLKVKKNPGDSYWFPKETPGETLQKARRQY